MNYGLPFLFHRCKLLCIHTVAKMSPLLSISDILVHLRELTSLACAHANRPQ
jgi:hypothetical protein